MNVVYYSRDDCLAGQVRGCRVDRRGLLIAGGGRPGSAPCKHIKRESRRISVTRSAAQITLNMPSLNK